MNKKGFTLIELLAVFVILGIILIITISKVNDTLEKSRKGIALEDTNRLIRAFDEYYVRMKIKNDFNGCTYNFVSNSGCDDFSFEGQKPTDGSITLSVDGIINGNVKFNKFEFNIVNGNITYVSN